MIRNSGLKDNVLENKILEVTKVCVVCKKFQKPAPRPVVSLPLASNFNEVIAMDLKCYGKLYFLVIVDVFTKYCAAAVINDKKPATILQNLFVSWISIFGPPRKILSDNGGEFCNSEMVEFAETFNVKLMATAAESPWSNGICERLNAVLGSSVNKIVQENNCNVKVALSWAVCARNALCTYTGYSPNQLVFGYNPAFPNFAHNDLPAMGKTCSSVTVKQNLTAMHSAREDYIKMESNTKLQRAMACNVRENEAVDVKIGHEVYYKRNESNEWKGPAVVIGRDGKQLIVRHGGMVIRVHVCRLVKVPCEESKIVKSVGERKNQVVCKPQTMNTPDMMHECDETNTEDVGADNSDEAISIIEPSNDEIGSPSFHIPQEEPSSAINEKVVFKTGQRVRGICAHSGESFGGKIVSRAGKATGMYKNSFNIQNDEDHSISSYDLVNDFSEIEIVSDDTELLVFFNSDDVMQAKEKEIENWCKNNVYEEVSDIGQDTISVRWVVTEKIKENKTVTKARLVARGFEEESSNLRKDSPTCSKEAIRIVLALSSAKGWECNSMDIKSAYLQGDKIDRDIFLIPPPEYNDGQLWKLHKTVYGLCDAARVWYLRVKQELKKLNVNVSTYDNGLFSYFFNGKVEGMICVHVDDFLWCGTNHFKTEVIDKIAGMFSIGSYEKGMFKYVGLNILSGGNSHCTIDQIFYASSIKKIPISRARLNNKNSELNKKEKGQYRAHVGQLNWLATQTRPDIAFDTCFLSGSYTNATVGDLLKVNKLIDRVKHQCVKVAFPSMRKIEECHLLCYADASFANLPGEGSQGGMLVLLRDEDGNQCPIHWQTRKIRRVVKSTLAAETLALLDCAEEGVHLSSLISELLNIPKLQVYCKVDNKSLVDALQSSKLVEGKRLRVEIAVLQEMLDKKDLAAVTWVPTSTQLANCLTKGGVSAKSLLETIAC